MKPREYQRQGFKISLTMHGIVLVLMLVWPFVFRACNRHRPNEQLTFVEFTVSLPPPPAPDVPEPPTLMIALSALAALALVRRRRAQA